MGKRKFASPSTAVSSALENRTESATNQGRFEPEAGGKRGGTLFGGKSFAPWSTSLDGQRFPLGQLTRLASLLDPLSPAAENPRGAASEGKLSHPTKPSAFPASHTCAIPGGDNSYYIEEALAEHKKEEPMHDNVAADQLTRPATPSRLEQMPIPRIPVIPGLVRHHSPLVEQVPNNDEALSVLTANIQRILDEEARRHGIDV